MNGHVPIIKLLLSHGARIASADQQHCTPLHLACKKGALESVTQLLAYGANIYATDHRQWTPLHYASYNGFPKVCKKLLTWSADTDPKLRNAKNSQNKVAFNICKNPDTKLGFRIIWKSAKEGDLDMVRILIREGQDPNEQTQHERNTPLHLAAQNGHILIVMYLLDQKAVSNMLNSQDKTPLDLCKESLRKFEPKATKKISTKSQPTPKKGSLHDRLIQVNKRLTEAMGLEKEAAAEDDYEKDFEEENKASEQKPKN